MKLTIHPVRRMKKGKTWIWLDCEPDTAQAWEVRHGKDMKRRENKRSEAERIVALFGKPRRPTDKRSLVGRRWDDVKDKL